MIPIHKQEAGDGTRAGVRNDALIHRDFVWQEANVVSQF